MLLFAYPWMSDALCGGADPAAWDNEKTGNRAADMARRDKALELCRNCRVMIPCLEVAYRNKDLTGIWGGTDEQERLRMREEGDNRWMNAA